MEYELKTWSRKGLTFTVGYSIDYYTRPNDIWGIFTLVDDHQAGKTIKDPESGQYYVSCNYTPAELAKEYAKQGRENPSREAYESLQRELQHYLYGDCITIQCSVTGAGKELAFDCIGGDHSDFSGDSIENYVMEIASEHFDYKRLEKDARHAARADSEALAAVATANAR